MSLKVAIFLLLSSIPAISYAAEEAPKGRLVRLLESINHSLHPRITFVDPPPADFYLNALPSFYELPDQTEVIVMRPEHRILNLSLANSSLFIPVESMEIYLNSAYDEHLLKFTRANGGRETAYVAAFNLQGETLGFSDMLLGQYGMIYPYQLRFLMNQVLGYKQIGLVDLVHVHPGYEFLYKLKSGRAAARGSPLSSKDIRETIYFSQEYPRLYVRIRAVLPNGYSYSMTFLNGRQVFDPIYSVSAQGRATKIYFFELQFPKVKINSALEEKIASAQDPIQLTELALAAAKEQESPEDSILKQIGILKTEPDYNLWRANANALLGQGRSQAETSKMIQEHYLRIEVESILEQAGRSIADKDYYLDQILAKTLLSQGRSRTEVVQMIRHTNEQIAIHQQMYGEYTGLDCDNVIRPTN